jgi:hypothetical protein
VTKEQPNNKDLYFKKVEPSEKRPSTAKKSIMKPLPSHQVSKSNQQQHLTSRSNKAVTISEKNVGGFKTISDTTTLRHLSPNTPVRP